MKKLFALLTLTALSTPSFALQFCALDVAGADGIWREVVKANRGEEFGDATVNKLDDGDTCRRNGRQIGPDECRAADAVQYRIRAMKNSGVEKSWFEQC
jgi:hypothetical protein